MRWYIYKFHFLLSSINTQHYFIFLILKDSMEFSKCMCWWSHGFSISLLRLAFSTSLNSIKFPYCPNVRSFLKAFLVEFIHDKGYFVWNYLWDTDKGISKFQYPVFLVRWKPVVANRQYHLLQGFMLYFEQRKLSITFPGMEVRLTGL